MQVDLFRALQSIKVPDERAATVVEKLEEHIAVKINEANKGLEAKLDALRSQITFIGIMLGLATLIIAGATVGAKFIH
jgi:hypothetical protein